MDLRRIRVYAKLTGISLVLVYVLLFIILNRQEVSVNLVFWRTPEIPLFWFTLGVATSGALVFRVISGIRRTVKEFTQLRKEDRAREEMKLQVQNEIEQRDQTREGAE